MIGKLRHRVSLLRPVRSPDSGGGAAVEWQGFATVWAKVLARPSRPDDSARQDIYIYRKRLITRHRNDINHGTRLLVEGRTYEIRSIQPIEERGRFLVLELEEIRA